MQLSFTTLIRDPRWRILGGALLFYFLLWHSLDGFAKAIDPLSGGFFGDFTDHFYPEGRIIFSSAEPVGGFFYPPFAAILFGIIALLPLAVAKCTWGMLQLAALALLYILPLKELSGLTVRHKSIYTFLFLTSLPVLHNLKWGQVDAILMAGILASLYFYGRERKFLSSCILAFTISIKYYPAILLIYFVLRRDLRYVLTSTLMAMMFGAGIPVMVIGYGRTVYFMQRVAASAADATVTWVARDPNSQAFSHVLYRCLNLCPAIGREPIIVIYSSILAAIIVFLWIALKNKNRITQSMFEPALLFTLTPFFIPTSWVHYFIVLPALQLYTMPDALSGALSVTLNDESRNKAVNMTKTGLWIGSVALSNVGMFLLCGDWLSYTWYGAIFWADVMMLALVFAQMRNKSGALNDIADLSE